MEAPILQITVLSGPRNGEILVCEPESTIRIGRVVGGNDLALRDPGISQKHLRFQFIREDSRWFVSDLDTSNGTIVNGSRIQASVLVPVSDGDVFLIGEKTKLGVKIVTPRVLEEKEEGNNVRRRRRRVTTRRGGSLRVNTTAPSSRVSEEEASRKEPQSRVSAPVRGRKNNAKPISARVSNEGEKKEETLDPDLVSDSRVKVGRKGRGRGRGNTVRRDSARVLGEEKEDSRDLVTFSYSETKESDQNREAKLRRNPRRGTSSGILKELDPNRKFDSGLQMKEVGTKRKGRGRGGKRKTSTVSEEETGNDENLVLEMDTERFDPETVAFRLGKGIMAKPIANSSVVIGEKGGGDAGVKEGGERNGEEAGVAFENATLDEWFDSMERLLPKVIYEESEEIIGTLKEKARNFDELLYAGIDAA